MKDFHQAITPQALIVLRNIDLYLNHSGSTPKLGTIFTRAFKAGFIDPETLQKTFGMSVTRCNKVRGFSATSARQALSLVGDAAAKSTLEHI